MQRPSQPAFGSGGFRFGHGFPMTRWAGRLMLANFAVFVLMALSIIPRQGAIEWLGFSVPGFLVRPWSLVSYMFLHGSFGHLFMNMLALFFFGPPLEGKWGSRFFLKYYLASGLGGAAASVLLYSITGPTLMVGASGAIFGLLVAFAMNWPDAKIYVYFVFPVRAKWFVAGLGAVTLLSTVQGSADGVAHWAHLGGLVTGFVYLRYGERIGRFAERALYKEKATGRERAGPSAWRDRAVWRGKPIWRGKSARRPRREERQETRRGPERSAGAGPKAETSRGPKAETSRGPKAGTGQGTAKGPQAGRQPSSGARAAGRTGPRPPRRVDGDSLDEVDRILDKIKASGMDSLTPSERAFLDEVSRQFKSRAH